MVARVRFILLFVAQEGKFIREPLDGFDRSRAGKRRDPMLLRVFSLCFASY